MIIVRNTFYCKWGKGGEALAVLKEARERFSLFENMKIMTDASGRFFTLVTEEEIESFAVWEKRFKEMFENPGFGELFSKLDSLVRSGSRDFLNLE